MEEEELEEELGEEEELEEEVEEEERTEPEDVPAQYIKYEVEFQCNFYLHSSNSSPRPSWSLCLSVHP